jgi:MSHA biogenesis protein MshP
MKRTLPRFAPGFTIVSALFILVILASLGAFVLRTSQTQHLSAAQDLQGARAYQAARAGIEWGLYQVQDPTNATVVAPAAAAWPNLPACPATTTLALEGFSVQVTCTRYPTTAAPNDIYRESGNVRSSRIYELTATASMGTPGTPGYAERQLMARTAKCRSSDGLSPTYACP